MKKLLLCSNGKFLIEQGYPLLGIPLPEIKLAYITTASGGVTDKTYLKKHQALMWQQGITFEALDIEGKTQGELLTFLQEKNIVHIEGGNTLYLLRAIRKTGFDVILKEAIEAGLAFAGTSAGSMIACSTITFSSWADGAPKEEKMGLGLVPFDLKVHYTDDMALSLREMAKNHPYPIRLLRDGQGILVEDENYTFVGEGEETKL